MLLKILIVIAYLGMILMNVLANALPLFGRTTGEISAKYDTLFTPAGFTFSIWGIIYILLGVTVFRLVLMPESSFAELPLKVFVYLLIASCVFNAVWLVFWHLDTPWLSTLIIVFLLLTLIIAYRYVPVNDMLIRITISVYLAWISVATIANITIALYAINFGSESSQIFYFIGIIMVGVVLVASVLYFERDIAFAFVILWAFYGIFSRHYEVRALQLYLPVSIAIFLVTAMAFITFVLNSFSVYKN